MRYNQRIGMGIKKEKNIQFKKGVSEMIAGGVAGGSAGLIVFPPITVLTVPMGAMVGLAHGLTYKAKRR